MYTQEAINVLKDRIGWSGLSSGLPVTISDENKTSESGVTFDWFQPMVLPEIIYSAVPEKNMEQDPFNAYLQNVKLSAVKSVLKNVIDQHEESDSLTDYSSIIIEKKVLFDEAIGYSVAIKMIELYLSTTRNNFQERSAKMSYQTLKVELEGAKNDQGHFIARGLFYKYSKSIKDIQKIIFPFKITVNGDPIQ